MDVPYDVWLRIVEFLPRDFVRTLFTVNSSLFAIAMDERYREVDITKLDQRTLWMLFRLRDPSIIARVRCLRVNPYIQSTTQNLWLGHTSSKSWKRRVRNAVDRVLRIKRVHQWHSEKRMVGVNPGSSKKIYLSFDDVIGGMIDAFPTLSHVSEFAVQIGGWNPVYDIRPFYDAAWAAFGSNLRKITLSMGMETFPDVLRASALHFPRLQEIGITFFYTPTVLDTDNDIICRIVAPFINRHESTIRTFSFTSRYPRYFSALFISLGLFPVLQHFALEVPFNDCVWSSNSGFTRFLRNHAKTLRHVDIGVINIVSPQIHWPSCYRSWVIENAADKAIFRGLESLTIPTVEMADFDSMLLIIQNSIRNLTKLSLTGRHLLFGEVRDLVGTLSRHPLHGSFRSLQLNILRLTPSIVCLFIEAFPLLRELDLFTLAPFSPTDQHRFPLLKRSVTGTFLVTASGIHIIRDTISSGT